MQRKGEDRAYSPENWQLGDLQAHHSEGEENIELLIQKDGTVKRVGLGDHSYCRATHTADHSYCHSTETMCDHSYCRATRYLLQYLLPL